MREAAFAILLVLLFLRLQRLEVPTFGSGLFSAYVDVAAPKPLASDRFNGTGGPYVLPVFKVDGAGRQLENGRPLARFSLSAARSSHLEFQTRHDGWRGRAD